MPTPTPTPTAREIAAERIAEVIDGPPEAYADVVDLLVDLWLLDAELGTAAAKQPWIIGQKQADDGTRSRTGDSRILESLHDMASTDIELARLSVNVPWFVDGLTYHEYFVLRWLAAVANNDVALAKLIAGFPWFSDGPFDDRDASYGLQSLAAIASTDIALARKIAETWIADGISFHEANSLEYVNQLASKDIELARRISVLSWLADGFNEDEWAALRLLNKLIEYDLQLTRDLTRSSWFADGGIFASYVLDSLLSLADYEVDVLGQLLEQLWSADGLDEKETALVVTLGQVAAQSPELYADLLGTHYTQYRAASLPMAGDVNIWIFQNTPFPPDEDLLTVIEDTARIGEELLGVPFPRTDIILLVVDRSGTRYRVGPGHFDTHMRLVRDGKVYHLPHETAHYWFFHPRTGPLWLTEGAAEFIAAYVEDRTGGWEIAASRLSNATEFSYCLDYFQIENIRHLAVVMDNEWEITHPRLCLYQMGEYFLHGASGIAGEEAIMSALGELHLSETGREYDSVEDRIYEVFLKHVPDSRREDFRTFYREVHGGAAAFGNTDFSDDHGDEAEFATAIAAGESIGGSLDYMFDFDYFRLRAQEGKKYRINVDHDTLRASSVGLYAPDGQTGMNRSWITRDMVSTGPRIVWMAPSSEDYYVAVHNFGGKTGRYILTIDAVDDAVDDHGDTPESATVISLGETVQGTVNDDFDIDYFRFSVERDQGYGVLVMSVTLEEFLFSARTPSGGIWTADTAVIRTCCPHGFQFGARDPGNATLSITGIGGSVGTYTFKVIPVDN